MKNNHLLMLICVALLILGSATFAVARDDTDDLKAKMCNSEWQPVSDGVENKLFVCFTFDNGYFEKDPTDDVVAWKFWNKYDKPVSFDLRFNFPNSKFASSAGERNIPPGKVRKNPGNSVVNERTVPTMDLRCFQLGGGDCVSKARSSTSSAGSSNSVLTFPGPAKSFQILEKPDKATPEQKVSAGQKGDWSKVQTIEWETGDIYLPRKNQIEFTSRWAKIGGLEFKFSNPAERTVQFYYVLELKGISGKTYTKESTFVIGNSSSSSQIAVGQSLSRVVVCTSREQCEKLVPDAFKR